MKTTMLVILSQDERLKDILLDRKEQLLEHIDLTEHLASRLFETAKMFGR